jgi:hypothetical protein
MGGAWLLAMRWDAWYAAAVFKIDDAHDVQVNLSVERESTGILRNSAPLNQNGGMGGSR